MATHRVLLFGLSANPPTGERGHLGLIRWVVEEASVQALGDRFDEVWILPVHRHAYSEKSDLVPFEHRLNMCKLCFERQDWRIPVRVSTAEQMLSLERPQENLGTIDLVDFLESRRPGVRFAFLMGADTAEDLLMGRWKRGQELRSRVGLVVVPRDGIEISSGPGLTVAHEAPRFEASSTKAREAAVRGQLDRWVTEEVEVYARDHRLYGAFDSPSSTER